MLYVPFKIYYSFNLINFLHVSKYPTKTLMTLSSISHHRTIIYLTKPLVFGHLSCISFFFHYNKKCCDEHLYIYTVLSN